MSQELKNKLRENARHLRFISRSEMFQRNRKAVQQLDYLKYYTPEASTLIIKSISDPLPEVLPALAPHTISYYRRLNKAVYRTKFGQNLAIDGHMAYESLWILACIQEKQYDNYKIVKNQFQHDLPLFLSANSTDIREMAIIASGNKIIGKESDIIVIVESDFKQMWVLINHIYAKNISFKKLFKYISREDETIYKTLYELTNNKADESILAIISDQTVLETILNSLKSNNFEVKKYCIRIIGNIVAEQNQHATLLLKYNLLDYLFPLIMSSDNSVRRDVFWLFSNLCCERNSATRVIRHQTIMAKLIEYFDYEQKSENKKQLTHIFSYLAHYAEKRDSFEVFVKPHTLELCYKHLCIEESELNTVTLFFLTKLIDLAQNFKTEDDKNYICLLVNSMPELKNEISKKSYEENDDISGLSLEIISHLDEDQQY